MTLLEKIGASDSDTGSVPTYAGTFRCIGERCEDICCGDWDIPLDRAVYEQYLKLPQQKLGSHISRFVQQTPSKEDENQFAILERTEDGVCPCLDSDRKCQLQKQCGPSALPSACSIYPRSLCWVNGKLEGALSLSCPEAARQVLMRPEIFTETSDLHSAPFKTDNVYAVCNRGNLAPSFVRIRSTILEILRDRSKPIWQRLLVTAGFCARLDEGTSLGISQAERTISQYREMAGQGPSAQLALLRSDLTERLEFAIQMGDIRRRSSDCGQRFRDIFAVFVEGIGAPHSTGPEATLLRFESAHRKYLLPLLESYPFIAENYLVNYVYQHQFPFGRAGSASFIKHSMYEEAVLLIAHFSWLMTLLTGVAGRFKNEFSQAHIVTATQALTRAAEHSPQVGEDLLDYLRARNLLGLDGLAKLLRNEG